MSFADAMDHVAQAFEAAGAFVLLAGLLLAVAMAVRALRRSGDGKKAYRVLRQSFGGVILLGLEILVAADLVRTVAVEPTLANVVILGGIVLIRTVLSFSLEIEIEGVAPWRRAARAGPRTSSRRAGMRAVRSTREPRPWRPSPGRAPRSRRRGLPREGGAQRHAPPLAGGLVTTRAGSSVGALLLLLACTSLAYAGSLAAFHGGPTFPAVFLGGCGGDPAHPPVRPAAGARDRDGHRGGVRGDAPMPLTSVLAATLVLGSDGLAAMSLVIVAVTVPSWRRSGWHRGPRSLRTRMRPREPPTPPDRFRLRGSLQVTRSPDSSRALPDSAHPVEGPSPPR